MSAKPSSAPRYSGASPQAAAPVALSGAWADGAGAASAPPAASAATTTPAKSKPGVDGAATADKTPGGSVKVGGPGGGGATFDSAALKSLLDESVHNAVLAAVKPLHEEIGALRERVDIAEAISESRAASDRESVDDDSTSDGTSLSDLLADAGVYVGFDSKSNPHFGAAELAANSKYKPSRYELYGHKPWNVLTKFGEDTNGALAQSLSYAEPFCMYGKAAFDRADDLASRVAAGDVDQVDFLEDMVALRNTLREVYKLSNVFRTIIVQKARALRPGATAYDKAEVKYLERALAEHDYASPDTAPVVAALRGQFAKRASRSDLDRLAKQGSKGGGGGGGGGGAASDLDSGSDADSESGKKSKSQRKREKAKAKQREARERGGGGGRGGGDGGARNGRDGGSASRNGRDGDRGGGGGRSGGGSRNGRGGSPHGSARGDGGGRPPHAEKKPKSRKPKEERRDADDGDDESGFE